MLNQQPVDVKLWEEFCKYFKAFVVEDINKSLEASVEVGTIILTTVGIECLSGYYAGKKAERKHFVKFMQDFMPGEYRNFADDIYTCIRNGLAHDYIVKRNAKTKRTFLFRHGQDKPNLELSRHDQNLIFLNRETFARDFLNAQDKYFEKATSDQSVWDNAIKRLRKRGFLTVRPEEEFTPQSKP